MTDDLVTRETSASLAADLEGKPPDVCADILHLVINRIATTARSVGHAEGVVAGLTKAEGLALSAQAGGAANGNARRNIALAAHAAVVGRIRDELAKDMHRAVGGDDETA